MTRTRTKTMPDGSVQHIPLTDEQDTARDAEVSQAAQDKADYLANEQYKDDRREAYGSTGSQLDMQYWDGVNDTTVWVDHVAAVKSSNPKP